MQQILYYREVQAPINSERAINSAGGRVGSPIESAGKAIDIIWGLTQLIYFVFFLSSWCCIFFLIFKKNLLIYSPHLFQNK
jgi:hypothetical protein